jgi:cbb3-type cytochrome oxidase maturation protein
VSIIYLVLPLALLIVLSAVIAFVWAARRGQFDDRETPALRILHDDAVTRVNKAAQRDREAAPSHEEPGD